MSKNPFAVARIRGYLKNHIELEVLQCQTCGMATDLNIVEVGERSMDGTLFWSHHLCPRCHGDQVVWQTTIKPPEARGCLFIVDEREE